MFAMIIVSCKKSAFVEANINPSSVSSIDPSQQFQYASVHFPSDFEYYYDYYQFIMPWMQMTTSGLGNSASFNVQGGNFNYRYSNFYTNVGLALADIPHLIEKMTAQQAAERVYENAIASIAKAYYAFYVSDVDGSIPFSQAFQARYGGTLTPTYDTQENLFDSLDLQIKNAVTTLETTQSSTQVLYGADDPFYGTSAGSTVSAAQETTSWEKAGNALRLKIALRLLKRNASGVQTIAQQVLADANQMSSVGDSWVLTVGPSFATQSSNYNPAAYLGGAPMINFMNATNDPREPIFFRPDSSGLYIGSPTDPDSSVLYQSVYTAGKTYSPVQHRLFTPNFNENDGNGEGTGTGFFPYLTYAEYCFIRADLAARGVTTDNAQTWYTNGVTASIQFYANMGVAAQIAGLDTAGLSGSIATYLTKPGVAYSAAIATQQIACQAYIDFYRQPSEAWAWWKRTGYPNTTTPLAWQTLTGNGTAITINRRTALTALPSSDANYVNQQAAFTQMATDPGWGSTPQDALGRVWWDQQ